MIAAGRSNDPVPQVLCRIAEQAVHRPHSAACATGLRASRGTPTRKRRSVSDMRPPQNITKVPSQIKEAITPRTVAYHKYGMMEQLGIQSSAVLVQYAVKQGLVAPHPASEVAKARR